MIPLAQVMIKAIPLARVNQLMKTNNSRKINKIRQLKKVMNQKILLLVKLINLVFQISKSKINRHTDFHWGKEIHWGKGTVMEITTRSSKTAKMHNSTYRETAWAQTVLIYSKTSRRLEITSIQKLIALTASKSKSHITRTCVQLKKNMTSTATKIE